MDGNRIDWGKIVTNAISTLVAALVVGAAAIIWNGVSTVDSRIADMEAKIQASIDVMSESIFDLQDDIDMLREELVHRAQYIPNAEESIIEEPAPSRGSRDMRQQSILEEIQTKSKGYK